MSFTKPQREELNNLSNQLFGTTSKWQKLLNKPEFRVVTETVDSDKKKRYVALHNSKKNRAGTVLSLDKAVARGLFSGVNGEELLKNIKETPVKVVESREPTFDELRQTLVDQIDLQKLGRLADHELGTVVAYRLVNNNLNFSINLSVKESDQENFNQILNTLSEDLKEKINKINLKAEDKNPNAIDFDGLTFIKDVAFVVGHPDEAFTDYVNLLAEPLNLQSREAPVKVLQQQMNSWNRKRNNIAKDKQKRPGYYAQKELKTLAKAKEATKERAEAAELRAKLDSESKVD